MTAGDTETQTAPANPGSKDPINVSQVGNLATVTVAGIPAGTRCIVSFKAPSGNVISAVAIADDEGNLTSWGRLLEDGKYKISIADGSGEALHSTQHTSRTG